MIKYDAIIIGTGQAGSPLAKKLAAAGWKVAIIEKGWVGGTCVNVGCTPTKTLIASGRIAHLAGRSSDYGIRIQGKVSVDITEVIKRKNAIVLPSRENSTKGLLETHNVELIFGTAHFSGHKEVTVTKEEGSTSTMTAERIFINTGVIPKVPAIPGLDGLKYFDSSTILDLMEIPEHLVIIGGSYIALEFGQLYRRLGSKVTVIESGPRFLPKEDDDIAGEIRTILGEEGLSIFTGQKVLQVSPGDGSRGVRVKLSGKIGEAGGASPYGAGPEADAGIGGSEGVEITGTHLLIAAGREADTRALHSDATGVLLDERGFIRVNDRLETNVPGIYALGDVKGGPQFTHISYNDHLIVYKNLVEKGNESIAGRTTIYCLFTDPELGRVGLTEREAREKGIPVRIAKMPVTHIARAGENGETKGLVKAIVHAESRKIIGAAVLTPGGGELMSILQMAMMGDVTYDIIRDMVFAHPTYAESLNNLFARLED